MVHILEKIVNKSHSLYNTAKIAALVAFTMATMNAQTGSGTHTATTQDNQTSEINIQGTSTFDTGEYVFNLSGNLGTPIDFNEWPLVTLSTADYDISDNIILGATSKELNAYFKLENPQNIQATLYNMQGQSIGPISSRNGPNGLTQLFFDGSHLSDGIYIAQVQAGNQQGAFKVPLIGNLGDGQPNPFPQNNSFNRNQNDDSIMSRNSMTNNYNIVISGEDINEYSEDIMVEEGDANAFTFTVVGRNGDTAVLPQLNGSPINNTTITLTNQNDPTKTYTYNTEGTGNQLGIFENIFVDSPDFSDTYTIEVTSNEGIFLPTTVSEDIFQDVNGEVNGLKTVEVNQIPNEQTINGTIRDYQTLSTLSGITVNLYEDDGDNDLSNDVLLDSQVSGANGEYSFADVPGETSVYIVNTADGYYTKTNGTYTTPLVDTLDEMDTTLNVVAVPKFNYEDATPVEASRISDYRPLADHTEFALGHWRVYFPDISGGNQVYKDHFDEVAATLGNPGAIIDSDTAFPNPETNGTYETYQPYQDNREVHTGLIGTNITNYSGTGTGRGEKVSILGENMTFYTTAFNLGGLDWSDTDHEIGNALGFPLLTGTSTFQTSRDSSSAENVAIIDSKWDKAIMPLWLDLTKLHYDTTDTQGRLIEYSMPRNFQE